MEAAKQCLVICDQRVYGKEGWVKATSPIRRRDSTVVRWTYERFAMMAPCGGKTKFETEYESPCT